MRGTVHHRRCESALQLKSEAKIRDKFAGRPWTYYQILNSDVRESLQSAENPLHGDHGLKSRRGRRKQSTYPYPSMG